MYDREIVSMIWVFVLYINMLFFLQGVISSENWKFALELSSWHRFCSLFLVFYVLFQSSSSSADWSILAAQKSWDQSISHLNTAPARFNKDDNI